MTHTVEVGLDLALRNGLSKAVADVRKQGKTLAFTSSSRAVAVGQLALLAAKLYVNPVNFARDRSAKFVPDVQLCIPVSTKLFSQQLRFRGAAKHQFWKDAKKHDEWTGVDRSRLPAFATQSIPQDVLNATLPILSFEFQKHGRTARSSKAVDKPNPAITSLLKEHMSNDNAYKFLFPHVNQMSLPYSVKDQLHDGKLAAIEEDKDGSPDYVRNYENTPGHISNTRILSTTPLLHDTLDVPFRKSGDQKIAVTALLAVSSNSSITSFNGLTSNTTLSWRGNDSRFPPSIGDNETARSTTQAGTATQIISDLSDSKLMGDVYLDGAALGRWLVKSLTREVEHSPASRTSFDTRRSRVLPGPTIGGL